MHIGMNEMNTEEIYETNIEPIKGSYLSFSNGEITFYTEQIGEEQTLSRKDVKFLYKLMKKYFKRQKALNKLVKQAQEYNMGY